METHCGTSGLAKAFYGGIVDWHEGSQEMHIFCISLETDISVRVDLSLVSVWTEV